MAGELINQLTGQKLSLVKRYLSEIVLIVLTIAVVYLFIALLGLQTEFRSFVIVTGSKQSEVISNNTRVVEENSKVIGKNNELQQKRIDQTDALQSKTNP